MVVWAGTQHTGPTPITTSLDSDEVTAAKWQQSCDKLYCEACFIQEFSSLTADFINCLLFSYFDIWDELKAVLPLLQILANKLVLLSDDCSSQHVSTE